MAKVMGVNEAAKELDMHPQTVRELLRRGDLAGVKMPGLRGAWKVRPEAIERFLNRHAYAA